MSARRTFSNRNLLSLGGLWLGCFLAAPVFADTTAPLYDPNGNLTSRTTSLGTTTYGYDALDRLKSEAGPGVNQAFGYDKNGNRLSDGTNTYTLAPNGNRIQTVNGITQVYDPAGHLLDDGQGKTFTYNAAGRLKEVRVNDVLVASYKYNYRGLRVRKTTPQGVTRYHYDREGRLIETSDVAGVPQHTYVWADDRPIAQVDHTGPTEKVAYLHTDHLITPRYATDANQTVVWRWEGEAFGHTAPNEDPDGDGVLTIVNLRFAGQYFDSETGLHYNGARYYDPKVGRYISSDPIGLAGGLNTYAYVSNNPLRWTDPFGLCKIEVRYAQVLEITGLGYPIKVYHAYLVTSDTDGTQKYFRGGPSRFGIPNWGPISAKFGDYVPGTPDWDPSTPPTDTILNNNSLCGCYNATLEQAAKDLNEAKVLYDPLGPNSNSTANFGLQRMNLGGHRPSVIAPGWGDPLIP